MTWSDALTAFTSNKRALLALGFGILGFYFLPYFLYGQDIYISVYDNLDSTVVWLKVLAHSGKIFADSMDVIPNMMSGIPRLSYGSEFNVILWLYYFFDDFTAYVINDIFMHSFAFISMFVLLSRYFIDEDTPNRNFIIFTASILFAMIPFWPGGGLTVAGQPLVLWAFLNIRAKKSTKIEWLILGLIPFYSSFVLSMLFFLFVMGVLFLYDLIKDKKINVYFMLAILFMTAIYLGVEYRLVQHMLLGSEFVSHRTEFVKPYTSFSDTLIMMTSRFLYAYPNTLTHHNVYVLPTIVIAMVFLFSNIRLNDKKAVMLTILFILLSLTTFWVTALEHLYIAPLLVGILLILKYIRGSKSILITLLLIQIAIGYWSDFWFYEGWKPLAEQFPILEALNLSRMFYLQPILWYMILGVALQVIAQRMRLNLLFIVAVLSLQSYHLMERRFFIEADNSKLSYKNYFATDLYQKVDDTIALPKNSFRVASVGINPVIAAYNGFYTIDGYSANYPLEHKHQFKKIIEKVRKAGMVQLFDQWGSKCYVFQNEYTYEYYQKSKLELSDFNADTSVMYDMGVRYLFSGYKINNDAEKSLRLIKVFSEKDAFWDLYLYKLENAQDDST